MSNISIHSPIESLPKVGSTLAKSFHTLGIKTVKDLLFYFPYRYLDFSIFTSIADIHPGETVTIRGVVKTIQSRYSFRGRMSLAEAVISDATGSLKVVWFNQPYIAKYLQPGDDVLLSGTPERYKQSLQLSNPVYEKANAEETIHTGRLVPVYHLAARIYNRTIRSLINAHLQLASSAVDTIPSAIEHHLRLLSLPEAIRELHFPTSIELLERAKLRAAFEEVFIQQLAVQRHKLLLQQANAPFIASNVPLIKQFLKELPFTLTDSQKKALWQIVQDMEGPHPMNRLLEGDVGSGKTLVALISMMETVDAGYQAVLLAPTEILAQQHYNSFLKYLQNPSKDSPIIGLLTSHFQRLNGQEISKLNLTKKIAAGEVHIVIGTHAILQKDVEFPKLGLVVVDEQHRFGVEQRAALLKRNNTDVIPHLLSMSATPIPRTLALSLYGDLDISTLTELPKGRQAIISKIVTEDERAITYDFIKKQLREGRQAFVITPLVEESERLQTKSAKAEFERLSKEVFSEFRVGLVYGKMKGKDKEAVMTAFNTHELDILVATSVIEIGIDVPNANVMVIEGAERFGLAQLHQLRGRVGRGQHQSYCLLFTNSEDEKTQERLELFTGTNDGFKLAELDFQQRGFGSLFGIQQTGFDFKFSRFITLKALQIGKQASVLLLQGDLGLKNYPELKKSSDELLEKIHLE